MARKEVGFMVRSRDKLILKDYLQGRGPDM
jgi:hypothetical protein